MAIMVGFGPADSGSTPDRTIPKKTLKKEDEDNE